MLPPMYLDESTQTSRGCSPPLFHHSHPSFRSHPPSPLPRPFVYVCLQFPDPVASRKFDATAYQLCSARKNHQCARVKECWISLVGCLLVIDLARSRRLLWMFGNCASTNSSCIATQLPSDMAAFPPSSQRKGWTDTLGPITSCISCGSIRNIRI